MYYIEKINPVGFLQVKTNENECVYSNLCILPPYQGSYDAFLVDFGKLMIAEVVILSIVNIILSLVFSLSCYH